MQERCLAPTLLITGAVEVDASPSYSIGATVAELLELEPGAQESLLGASANRRATTFSSMPKYH